MKEFDVDLQHLISFAEDCVVEDNVRTTQAIAGAFGSVIMCVRHDVEYESQIETILTSKTSSIKKNDAGLKFELFWWVLEWGGVIIRSKCSFIEYSVKMFEQQLSKLH